MHELKEKVELKKTSAFLSIYIRMGRKDIGTAKEIKTLKNKIEHKL